MDIYDFFEDAVKAELSGVLPMKHVKVASQSAVAAIKKRWGGEIIYLPIERKRVRDAAIKSAFNGRNIHELCRRHNVSRATVYRIVGKTNRT